MPVSIGSKHLHSMPVYEAITTYLSHLSHQRQWAPTTLHKYHCSLQGALRALPAYRIGAPSIFLNESPLWKSAVTGALKAATSHIPKQAVPATVNLVTKAIANCRHHPMKNQLRVALMLAWVTTARPGCISQLRKEDVTFIGSNLVVSFRRGKGVLMRGQAYTIATTVQRSWETEIRTYLKERRDWLFARDLGNKHLLKILKTVGLEQRSLRRGSLQTMAADPSISNSTLMHFSGHTSEKTLLRYLDWGRKSGLLARNATIASRHLQPTSAGRHPSS